MSTEELKTSINNLLEKIPENALLEVFEYLKTVEGKSAKEIEMSHHLGKILKEDSVLLEKLAK
jgi:hypothetical protein